MMHIAMVNREDARRVPGGDTTQMAHLGAAVEQHGVRVSYITLDDQPEHWDYDVVHVFNRLTLQKISDLLTTRLRSVPVVLTSNFWFDAGHWFEGAVRKQHTWRTAACILGHSLARRLYGRWQFTRWKGRPEFAKLKQAIDLCDVVITNSQLEIAYLRQQLRLQSETAVVPVGIDGSQYAERPQLSSSFRDQYGVTRFVLEVARIQPNKNQLALINALFDVPVPLVFVGQPSPYQDDYVAACHERGKQRGNVFFTGYWPDADLPGVFASARVHVLPSWAELPGIVSLEAGAAGCQVVSTSNGCAREYLGDLAHYCAPGDSRSIRTAVTSAFDAPATPALREHVLRNYTWDRAAEKLRRVYEDACHAGSKRR